MSRDFKFTEGQKIPVKMFYKAKWSTQAYESPDPLVLKNVHFYERLHYGVIDNRNNSIIPRTERLVYIDDVRVLDLVADSYALMRANLRNAAQKGHISQEGAVFGGIEAIEAYEDPRLKYGEYLGNILRFYNETHIPDKLGTTSIASYDDYVNHFFKLIFDLNDESPITMTRWNTTFSSNILHSGMAFKYSDIDYNDDQAKIDQIVDNSCFPYFKNICLNMGFSIDKNNPHVVIYDLASPANEKLRYRRGILTIDEFFNSYFIKTHTIDNELLYNNINLYYNKYVGKNSLLRITKIQCGKPVTEFKTLETVMLNKRPFDDYQEVIYYARIRNYEEGSPYKPAKMRKIEKKANYFLKKVDKPSAISYINDMFRDQVWNKDHGFDDAIKKLQGQTQTETRRRDVGASSSGGGSSSSY